MLKKKEINKLKSTSLFPFMIIMILLTAAIFFQGCTMHTHVKGIEPYVRPLDNKNYKVLETSEGQSSSFHLLWFFPVTTSFDYNEAIDQAINNKGGDNLIDVRFWHKRQYWIVGTIDILYVKGKVIRYEE